MRVRDLGALTVEIDGAETSLRGLRPGVILAFLTISANARVSVESLYEAVWDGAPPAGAASTLESHVWRLRQVLEPNRAARTAPSVLLNEAGGYRLVVADDDVDSRRFARLVHAVGDAARDGQPERAVKLAADAEALWRGRPYEPFSDADWARATVAGLTELHEQLAELRNDALLALDHPDQALADLERCITENPYRERLWALRMRALFRLGRSEEALQTYQQARRMLVDEVGVGPGAELQQLHQQILRQDEAAAPERPTPATGPGDAATTRAAPTGARRDGVAAAPAPRTLRRAVETHVPARVTPLLGRESELSALGTLLRTERLVTITGAAGCGKTRLGTEVARDLTELCADGIWFVDLSTIDTADAVAEVVVSTIGFDARPGLPPAAALQEYLAGKDLLLVLDNCEHLLPKVAWLAEDLLAGGADGLRMLATSREALGIPGEIIWTLEPLELPDVGPGPLPETHLDEPPPRPAAALALFMARVSAADPTLTFDAHALRVAGDICVAVDGLPLALELAAARARSYTLDEIAEQVRADPGRLAPVGSEPGRRRVSLLAAIDSSYRLLEPSEQSLHRRLSVLPGPFVAAGAAVLLGDGHTGSALSGEVADVLTMLVHRSMLTAHRSTRHTGTTLFRQLIPVRAHAEHELDRAGELPEMLARRERWVVGLVGRRPLLGHLDDAGWYDDLENSYAVVRAELQANLEDELTETGVRLAAQLAPFWFHRARLVEGVGWLGRAVERGATFDPTAVGLCRLSLSAVLSLQGGARLTRPLIDIAVQDVARVDPERMLDIGLQVATLARSLWIRGEQEVVATLNELIGGFARERGDAELVVLHDALRCVLDMPGRAEAEAVEFVERVYEQALTYDFLLAGYFAGAGRVLLAIRHRRPEVGRSWTDRIQQLRRRLGDDNAALFLESRGNLAALAGDYPAAARLFAAAERECIRCGMQWPLRELTRRSLDEVRATLSQPRWEQERKNGLQLSEQEVLNLP